MASWKSSEAVLVSTPWGEQLHGLVYAHDAPNNLLVLRTAFPLALALEVAAKNQGVEFRLLNTDGLTVISDPAPPSRVSLAAFAPFDEAAAKEKEREAIAKAQVAATKIGKGVTKEAQTIFNAIEHIYPQTRWDGDKIVVMGEVVISAPYERTNVAMAPQKKGESALLARVQALIDHQQRKKH